MYEIKTVPFTELRVGMFTALQKRDGTIEASGRITRVVREDDGIHYTVDYGNGNVWENVEDNYRLSNDSSIACAVPVKS